ncbi:hypothetical protein [Noviherbaspirillum aerium]|uniref:hypothetical protein n=1 Tax=Noviherbaspirillum aerium TaxID=2588497 RepID=UPI00178C23E1|nr:hypothetical protein [Noviherbaspirillum aerium]
MSNDINDFFSWQGTAAIHRGAINLQAGAARPAGKRQDVIACEGMEKILIPTIVSV